MMKSKLYEAYLRVAYLHQRLQHNTVENVLVDRLAILPYYSACFHNHTRGFIIVVVYVNIICSRRQRRYVPPTIYYNLQVPA